MPRPLPCSLMLRVLRNRRYVGSGEPERSPLELARSYIRPRAFGGGDRAHGGLREVLHLMGQRVFDLVADQGRVAQRAVGVEADRELGPDRVTHPARPDVGNGLDAVDLPGGSLDLLE